MSAFVHAWCTAGCARPAYGLLLGAALAGASLEAATPDLSRLPQPASRPVDFTADIKPILEQSCIRCHGPVKPRSGFRLDGKDAALKGGSHGAAMVPGNSAGSPLIHYVARLVEDMEMPPVGKGDPLAAEQVALLRAWIDQGAVWGAEQPEFGTRISDVLVLGWVGVNGDEKRFREQFWQKEGVFGGIEEFRLQQKVGEQSRFLVEGRVLLDQSDYRVKLALENPELGFVRAGYQQFRHYFDDSGGYYAGSPIPQYDLGRDLYLDYGSVWAEVGLTLPNAPRLVLGYEHQFRDGEKSLLEWGPFIPPGGNFTANRLIYPSYKEIAERVDVIRFDISHDFSGLWVEDNFRSEHYSLQTRRYTANQMAPDQTRPSQWLVVDDQTSHDQLFNAVKVEKQIQDWWLASAGYLYTSVEGEAAFARNFLASGQVIPPTDDEVSAQVLIRKDSQYVNLNSLLGPWQNLTFSIGAQMEASTQHGLGNAAVFVEGIPTLTNSVLSSDLDTLGWEEKAALRFTGIPYSVLYAEGRWRQENYGQYEQETAGHHAFLRDTDAAYDLQEYRTGFNTSPWRQVSLQGSYLHRSKRNDYTHNLDENEFLGAGYSAFIQRHRIDSDQVEAKLVLKPLAWLKTTFGWQWVSTDYETVTDNISFAGPFVPGGGLQSGSYAANIYSAGAVLTPKSRLYCTVTYSYSDTEMTTPYDNVAAAGRVPAVVPYRGTVHSVLATVNYALSDAMDVTGNYSFSRADYAQNNAGGGLPLGVRYDLQALQAGLSRRFGKRISATLQYGFYCYEEPSGGGLNDYTAHAVFAGLHLLWP